MLDVQVEVSGIQTLLDTLGRTQPTLARHTAPIISLFASSIASSARMTARRRPSGLWRGRGAPDYRAKELGTYLFRVSATGRAEAMTEFARVGVTKQGGALVSELDRIYGNRAGGRVMWAAHDAREPGFIRAIERAVADAEKDMTRRADG